MAATPRGEPARVHCTQDHRPGHHDRSCLPPADPKNPELRLLRAIFGACPDCDHPEGSHTDTSDSPVARHICRECPEPDAEDRYPGPAYLCIPPEDLHEMESGFDG
jgi:hypothetical protein